MFLLNELLPAVAPELLALLRAAEPATIGHFRHVGFMAPEIRCLTTGYVRIAGTAVTARCYGADTTIVHYALGQLRPGDVLVLDRAGDRRHAACGGGVAFAAREAGCAGIVIDGMATDIQELREVRPACLGEGAFAGHRQAPVRPGRVLHSRLLRGRRGRTRGRVLADENGVLVIKLDEIRAAAERAIGMQQAEKGTLERLARGERMPDINGTNARIREIMAEAPR